MSDDLIKPHEHWRISVETSGDLIIAIETESLAGRELSPSDEATVLRAVDHILSFIGAPSASGMMARIRELETQLQFATDLAKEASEECTTLRARLATAEADALERAAKVADPWGSEADNTFKSRICIASHIRSLKPKGQE